MSKLDLDRGVEIRFHPANRMQVAMYVDLPGVYYTQTGEPIAAELARQAGFDVERDIRRKVANERLAAARLQIENELRVEEDVIAQALSNKSKMDVRHVGGGQYALHSKDGKRLTRVAMTKADAEIMLGTKVHADQNDSVSPAQPSELSELLGTAGEAVGSTQPAAVVS